MALYSHYINQLGSSWAKSRITLLLLSILAQLGHAQTPQDGGHLSSNIPRPPQAPYVFNDSADSINQTISKNIALQKAMVQSILDNVSPDNATFDNTILPYLRYENEDGVGSLPLGTYSLGTKPEVNEAIGTALGNARDVDDQIRNNEDLFRLIDSVYQKYANDSSLNEEEQIALKSVWFQFAQSGLNVTAGEQRDRFFQLDERLSNITDEFSSNLAKDTADVYFTPEELEGVPMEILQTYENITTGENAGKLKVDVGLRSRYPTIMNNAINETTRYTTFLTAQRKSPENVPLVQEAVDVRLQYAQVLGYPSYAAYALDGSMAETVEVVNEFLADIGSRVAPLGQRELETLNELKSKDEKLVSPVGDGAIAYWWDKLYYGEVERKTNYDVDENQVTAYFPADTTVPAILEFYGEIFGLKFYKIEGQDADELSPSGQGSDLVWHPDVMMYAVWDNQEYMEKYQVTDTGFRGYLYLDLFYREGVKSGGGGYMQPIQYGFQKEDGSYFASSCSVILNFQKSNDTIKPSLFKHADVSSVMHELGHTMHNFLSQTAFSRTHGTAGVPSDFLEFPSQLMQNWARVPQTLQRISKHWSSFSSEAASAWRSEQQLDPTSALPPATMSDDLIAKVINSTQLLGGLDTLRQIWFALYDQNLSQLTSSDEAKSLDVTILYNTLGRNVTMIPDPSDLPSTTPQSGSDNNDNDNNNNNNNTNDPNKWGHGESTFSNIQDRYAGTYYAYQWCLVYAEDVFYSAFVDDPFSSEVGMRFRTQVLQPGGARDLKRILGEFLGREGLDLRGYERYLGIGS